MGNIRLFSRETLASDADGRRRPKELAGGQIAPLLAPSFLSGIEGGAPTRFIFVSLPPEGIIRDPGKERTRRLFPNRKKINTGRTRRIAMRAHGCLESSGHREFRSPKKKKTMACNLLKGKKGLIFGALNEHSIAWKVAERAVAEGAEIVLTNTPVSIRMGEINQLAEKCHTIVVPADATSVEDLENLIDKTMEHFGGKFDFILHSIGMSLNVRKGRTYDDLDYDYLARTLDISAISFHKVIQVARKKDALNEWGSIVALSYIAAHRTLYGYNDMADAKALLESIARSFGYIYGREKHIRINTVSQSPTPTTAGNGVMGMSDLMDFANRMSPLGNANAEECADYVLMLFSDYTRKVTMQNLYHDGGFSSMGMSRRAMSTYEKGMAFNDVKEHQFPFGEGKE